MQTTMLMLSCSHCLIFSLVTMPLLLVLALVTDGLLSAHHARVLASQV
jgi:hypothetical protein